MGDGMVNRPRDFRHHDVVRAFKAARAAGVDNPSLRIRTPTGTEYFFGGEVKADVPRVRGKATPDAVSKGNLSSGKMRAPLAEGGSRHGMFKEQAADPARPGRTGKPRSAADTKQASGGLSRPARAGSCGT
jgi:hypothetical protein